MDERSAGDKQAPRLKYEADVLRITTTSSISCTEARRTYNSATTALWTLSEWQTRLISVNCWWFLTKLLSLMDSLIVKGQRQIFFYPLLGRARFRVRCWATIRLSHGPEPSGRAVHGEVDGFDIGGWHGRRFFFCAWRSTCIQKPKSKVRVVQLDSETVWTTLSLGCKCWEIP